jgi:LTXXQ motif family protein
LRVAVAVAGHAKALRQINDGNERRAKTRKITIREVKLMTRVSLFKSMVFSSVALATLAVTPASSENDDGWFWNRGRMGEWFRGEMMDEGMRHGWGRGMMMGSRFSDERLNALKTELSITAAQEKLWQDYAGAVKSSAEAMRAMHAQMMSDDIPDTLPDRLALHEGMMSARLEEIKSINAATLALYNVLDETQKKKADEIIMGMGMM